MASRDVSVEDSLYETVKELKDHSAQPDLPNGTAQLRQDEPPHHPPVLLNGHLSPCTPERGPLCAGVEYASVDLNKKSRHSADMEAKRRSDNAACPSHKPLEEPEEDLPPPVPEKVLDENDNQPVVMNGLAGAGLHNGEVRMVLVETMENKEKKKTYYLYLLHNYHLLSCLLSTALWRATNRGKKFERCRSGGRRGE